jgi:hypothetical protein
MRADVTGAGGISLVVDGESRRLSAAASRSVIDQFPAVRHQAAKWRLMLGRPGQLLLVDEDLCREISAFLDGSV